MPNWLKPSDEKQWERAKALAKEQGQGNNYAYITGIFKKLPQTSIDKSATLFRTQDALDKYLMEHPNADRKKHKVMHGESGGTTVEFAAKPPSKDSILNMAIRKGLLPPGQSKKRNVELWAHDLAKQWERKFNKDLQSGPSKEDWEDILKEFQMGLDMDEQESKESKKSASLTPGDLTRQEQSAMREFAISTLNGFMDDRTIISDFNPNVLTTLQAKGLVRVGQRWVTITDAGRKMWDQMHMSTKWAAARPEKQVGEWVLRFVYPTTVEVDGPDWSDSGILQGKVLHWDNPARVPSNIRDEALKFLRQQRRSAKQASSPRYCRIWKAANGRWYLDLANNDYGDQNDAVTYGPFHSVSETERFLDGFSNPGGWSTDDSGRRPPPTRSPNGDPVEDPEEWGGGRSRWASAKLKPGDLKPGDIVRHHRDFLQSSAWYTGVPKDGLVDSVVESGAFKGFPRVIWNNQDGDEPTPINPFNLERMPGRRATMTNPTRSLVAEWDKMGDDLRQANDAKRLWQKLMMTLEDAARLAKQVQEANLEAEGDSDFDQQVGEEGWMGNEGNDLGAALEEVWVNMGFDPGEIFKGGHARVAYEDGTKLPGGWGYEPGHVTVQAPYMDTGSQMPPARDRDGKPVSIDEYERLDIPGYTYHDKSPAFHSNPPGDASISRVKQAAQDDFAKAAKLFKDATDKIVEAVELVGPRIEQNKQWGKEWGKAVTTILDELNHWGGNILPTVGPLFKGASRTASENDLGIAHDKLKAALALLVAASWRVEGTRNLSPEARREWDALVTPLMNDMEGAVWWAKNQASLTQGKNAQAKTASTNKQAALLRRVQAAQVAIETVLASLPDDE
jgi:hypothetical protein